MRKSLRWISGIGGGIIALWPIFGRWTIKVLTSYEHAEAAKEIGEFLSGPQMTTIIPLVGLALLCWALWDWRRGNRAQVPAFRVSAAAASNEKIETGAPINRLIGLFDAYVHVRDKSQWRAQLDAERDDHQLEILFSAVHEIERAARDGEVAISGIENGKGMHREIPATYWRNAFIDPSPLARSTPIAVARPKPYMKGVPEFADLVVPLDQVMKTWPLAVTQRNGPEGIPNWEIQELFYLAEPGLRAHDSDPWNSSAGNAIKDRLSTGQLRSWGRLSEEGTLVEIAAEYWRHADWSYFFLSPDEIERRGMEHVRRSVGDYSNAPDYWDVQVNRAQALRLWSR